MTSVDTPGIQKGCAILTLVLILGLFSLIPARGQENGGETSPRQIEIGGIQFSDNNPEAGDNISISATIYNDGSDPIDNLGIVYLVDNIKIGNINGIKVGSGGSSTYKISWEAEEGTHRINVVLKYKGVLIEEIGVGKNLYVEPRPTGDLSSLLGSIGVILAFIFISMIVQGVIKTIRSE